MEDKYKALIACFGMGCATLIEVVNLVVVGLDGTIASAFVGAICTIVGLALGKSLKSEGSE